MHFSYVSVYMLYAPIMYQVSYFAILGAAIDSQD